MVLHFIDVFLWKNKTISQPVVENTGRTAMYARPAASTDPYVFVNKPHFGLQINQTAGNRRTPRNTTPVRLPPPPVILCSPQCLVPRGKVYRV